MDNSSSNEIYRLISLKLIGAASGSDLESLNKLLTENPDFQFLYDEMSKPARETTYNTEEISQAFLAHSARKQILECSSVTSGFSPVAERYSERRPRKLLRRIGMLTFFCVLTILLTVFFDRKNNPKNMVSEVSTKKGSKSKFNLPDGSQVWLNSESKIRFEDNETAHTREVTLSGEAFFDVKHDAGKPFIIHTGDINIRVLGTAFNVSNYPGDQTVQTTLVRGKIEVTVLDRPDEKVTLKPMDKLTVLKAVNHVNKIDPAEVQPEKIVLSNASVDIKSGSVAETAWVSDQMTFINMPLGKIAPILERHYGLKFVFMDPQIKNYHYTGSFGNVSISKVLEVFKTAKPIKYTISDSTVTVY